MKNFFNKMFFIEICIFYIYVTILYIKRKLIFTGPCGGVPSVKIARFQSLALFAQSRVLARLISESRTVLSSSTRWLLIMLRRFVIPACSAPVNTPTSVNGEEEQTKLQHYLCLTQWLVFKICIAWSKYVFNYICKIVCTWCYMTLIKTELWSAL